MHDIALFIIHSMPMSASCTGWPKTLAQFLCA